VGLFPEQHVSWNWLRERAVSLARPDRPLQALNLFAYTGGTTMSLAHAGVQVTHVDASAPAVRWARDNARDSGLADKPVRWIVEDARKFVTRAVRRGTQFDMIILDPPSYGHGPTGKLWKIEADLAPLLADCLGLLAGPAAVLLITGHSEHCNERFVVDCLTAYDGEIEIETGRSGLGNINGKILDAGFFVRAIVKS
jgi:23S rRNA (cytosine1962-C5)-methyltransferase